VVDYVQRTGQPSRPSSGLSQRYDGHPLRCSTSTERQRCMSYVANEISLPQGCDHDRLEPRMADMSLRPLEQSLTFRENVTATATQTESTEPSYLKKATKRLDLMTIRTRQPHYDETQRLTAQPLPADAIASSEARLTTRDFCHERTAGPYSPDSYSLPRLLEGATAT